MSRARFGAGLILPPIGPFADTIIATFLPTGALSALYYADRIHQLPIGVVGIAVGTVLLPEMARRLAAGDERSAADAQGRAIEFALLLAVPLAARAADDIPALVDLYLQGRLLLDEMVSAVYPLEDVRRAFDDLEAGKLARGVLTLDN